MTDQKLTDALCKDVVEVLTQFRRACADGESSESLAASLRRYSALSMCGYAIREIESLAALLPKQRPSFDVNHAVKDIFGVTLPGDAR